MGINKKWSAEELEYLEDKWGLISIKGIAKSLDRSVSGVTNMRLRLGLGAFLEASEYVTFNQLMKALNMLGSTSYKNISWIKNRNFPIKYKTVMDCKFKIVYLSEFWKWAERNRSMLDWSKIEKNILGMEPAWVDEQRKMDYLKNTKVKITPWTQEEDENLKYLLKKFKYSYMELSKMLHRTDGAIQKRIIDLGLKERPLKANNHIKWTTEEYALLDEMLEERYSYELMSEKLGKSSKAIRGRVYTLYGSENLDKVDLIRKQQHKERRLEFGTVSEKQFSVQT